MLLEVVESLCLWAPSRYIVQGKMCVCMHVYFCIYICVPLCVCVYMPEYVWLCMYIKRLKKESESESRSVVSDSLWPRGLYSPWNSPGQNTGVVSLSLLQGIFPTQGSNPGLPHFRQILDQLRHQGSSEVEEFLLNWQLITINSKWCNNGMIYSEYT